jgi:hypothetical protein
LRVEKEADTAVVDEVARYTHVSCAVNNECAPSTTRNREAAISRAKHGSVLKYCDGVSRAADIYKCGDSSMRRVNVQTLVYADDAFVRGPRLLFAGIVHVPVNIEIAVASRADEDVVSLARVRDRLVD